MFPAKAWGSVPPLGLPVSGKHTLHKLGLHFMPVTLLSPLTQETITYVFKDV